MRRMLFSAVIAVLLGACLVLAQPGNPVRPTPAGASLSGLPPTGLPPAYTPLGSNNVPAAMGVSGYGANPPVPLPTAFAPAPNGPPTVIAPNFTMSQPEPVPPPGITEVMGLNPSVTVPGIPMAPPVPEMQMPQRVYPVARMPNNLPMRVQSPPTAFPRGISPAYANLQAQRGAYPVAPGQMLVYPVGVVNPDGSVQMIQGGPAMQPAVVDTNTGSEGMQSPPAMSWQPGVGQVYRPMPQSPPVSEPRISSLPPKGTFQSPPAGPAFWASIEGLLWWVRSSPMPVLVATVSPDDGSGSKLVPLFGGRNVNPGVNYGLRGTAGIWLDEEHTVGATGSYFWLSQQSRDFGYYSQGERAIVRTFVNVADGNKPGAIPLANGNGSTGGSHVRYDIQLQGGDLSAVFSRNAFLGKPFHLLVGVRYLLLEESLRIEDRMTNVRGGIATSSLDSFATRNQFYGGQVGGQWNFVRGGFSADVVAKVAYGAMLQKTAIDGSTTLAMANRPPTVFPGGTLALPTNKGTYNDTKTALLPEVSLNLGYRVSEGLTLFAGYNFLYVSDVARPGSRIDTTVNPDFLPLTRNTGATALLRPAVGEHPNDFWAMGITAGFVLSY